MGRTRPTSRWDRRSLPFGLGVEFPCTQDRSLIPWLCQLARTQVQVNCYMIVHFVPGSARRDLNHFDLNRDLNIPEKKITDLNHLHKLVCLIWKNVYRVLCIMFKNNSKKLK